MDDLTSTNVKKDVDKSKNSTPEKTVKTRSKLLGNISSFFNSAFSASTDESVGLNFFPEIKNNSEAEESSLHLRSNKDLGETEQHASWHQF